MMTSGRSMMVGSIKIEFSTMENAAVAILKRHLAPRTIGLIERTLFRGSLRLRAVVRPPNREEASFPIRIGRVGLEKPITELLPSMVTYWPQGSSLAVQMVPRTTKFPVNHLGAISDDQLDFFRHLRVGTAVTLSLMISDKLDEIGDQE